MIDIDNIDDLVDLREQLDICEWELSALTRDANSGTDHEQQMIRQALHATHLDHARILDAIAALTKEDS